MTPLTTVLSIPFIAFSVCVGYLVFIAIAKYKEPKSKKPTYKA